MAQSGGSEEKDYVDVDAEVDELDVDIECLTCTVPGPALAIKTGLNPWKSLLSRMQENQSKSTIGNTKKGNGSGIKKKTNPTNASISKAKTQDRKENQGASIGIGDNLRSKHDLASSNSPSSTTCDNNYCALDIEPPFKRPKLGTLDINRNRRCVSHRSSVEQLKHKKEEKDFKLNEFLISDYIRKKGKEQFDSTQSCSTTSTVSPPAQLFSIFETKTKQSNSLSASKASASSTPPNGALNGTYFTKSKHNFNHVIYDFPEIQDGWATTDKQEIQLNNSIQSEPSTLNTINNKQKPRTCPFYKIIPGTKFSVDAFSYGVIPGIDVYFLSHFHSDHYVGLTKKFGSTIVCSRPTGNLVRMKLGVSEDCIRKLELNKVYIIQGAEVVLIEANHCPGSVIFLFRLPNSSTILHTGDFRYTPDILTSPFVKTLGRVSSLYLDTTYCDPKYDFPSQAEAVNRVIDTVQKHLCFRPKTLIACGAYCIGKERVFFSLAESIGAKVYCAPDKYRMLSALENSAFNEFMKSNEHGCQIHVLKMGDLNPTFLSAYLNERSPSYNNIIAIKPTGWEFSKSGQGFSSRSHLHDTVRIIGVPYSEHSSFSELRSIVKTIRPMKVQPTVNVGNASKRNSMMSYIDQWLLEGRSEC